MKTYSDFPTPHWNERDPSPAPRPAREEAHPAGDAAETLSLTGASRALQSRALETIAEGVFVVDLSQPRYPIIYANSAFEHLTGYAEADLVGQSYDMLQGTHGNPATFAEIRAALRDRRSWSGEVLVDRRGGTAVWHELRLMPVPNNTGQVRYALGIQADFTEQKDLLEGLRQAHKMAAIGWLAGGLAHDFNNLLTPILGYCDMLLADVPSPRLREGLEEIHKAGERGAALIRQLLALCRQQQPQPRILDLRTIVADVQGLLHHLLQKNVTLATVIDPALESIQAGPGQVEQILLNLVRNAGDAMPQGGTLTITLANVRQDADAGAGGIPPGSYVLLAVTDTGRGMSEAVRDGLFQPLFTTKDLGKGHGLGLFMVHGIVKQNHGFIRVTSRLGQGTRVAIYWPRIPSAASTEQPAQASLARDAETILLVEDEPGVRELMRWILQQQGYTVLEAQDGKEAVVVGRDYPGPIHLLLTDVVMPRMNAHELVAQLAPRRPRMKVLYLSGYGPEEEGDFLPKPFTPDALTRKVREVLDQD